MKICGDRLTFVIASATITRFLGDAAVFIQDFFEGATVPQGCVHSQKNWQNDVS